MGIFDSGYCLDRYRRLTVERPELFTSRPADGIRILTAPEDIASACDEAGRTYRKKGMVDEGLSVEKVARLELKEEVGSEFLSFHDLGVIHTTSSITPEVMHIVAGEITPPGEVGHGEGIAQAIGFSMSEIEKMIGDGRITDAPTIAACMRTRLAGLPPDRHGIL